MGILLAALESLALVGGTVHSMAPGEPPRVATILIEDGLIAAVGADVEVPSSARRVDATGLHLVPGLIDGMVNHDPDHDRLYVASGVTVVRDAGNSLGRILLERQAASRQRGPGPDLWIAGAVLDGAPPATTESVVLSSIDEVRDKLPRLVELGVDYFSMYTGLEPPVYRAAIELAHANGRQLWGPVPKKLALEDVLAAGQDGLFHLEAFLPAGATWETADLDAVRPAIERVAGAKIAVTPLLAVFGQRLIPPDAEPRELAYLGPLYVRQWVAEAEVRRKLVQREADEFLRRGLKVVDLQAAIVGELHARGVALVPGSASPNPWLLPGEALLSELSLWKRAGIPPGEILRLATAGAAETLGFLAQRGTLEKGKIADVVALRGDPTEDIANLHRPELVVLRGRVLDRAALDRMLDELSAAQRKLRDEARAPLEVRAPELPEGEVLLAGTVETLAAGVRVAAERLAVVREPDGTLAFCGRRRTPGSASTAPTELGITQRIRRGELQSFQLRIQSGRRTVAIDGAKTAGGLRVERRIDGVLADTVPVPDEIALVDAGSATADVVLGHERAPGEFKVLFFEDTDPAVGRWELRLDTDNTHLLRTPLGDRVIRFDPAGFPLEILERQGAAIVATHPVEGEGFSGPGLPLPEAKRPKPREASAPAPGAKAPATGGSEPEKPR